MSKITLNVPTSWDDITLEIFDKITLSVSGNLAKLEPSTAVIKAVTNLDDDTINNMDVISYQNLVNKLSFLNNYPLSKKIPEDKISLNGSNYDVLIYPQKMTAAQFIDYRSLLLQNNVKIHTAKLLAIFVIPEGHKYNDGYDFENVAKIIYKYMSIEYALSLTYFFETVFNSYVLYSLHSSMLNTKKSKRMLKRAKVDKAKIKKLDLVLKEIKETKKNLLMNIKKKSKTLTKLSGHK